MSCHASDKFCGRCELYHLLNEALEAEQNEDYMDYEEFIAELRMELS